VEIDPSEIDGFASGAWSPDHLIEVVIPSEFIGGLARVMEVGDDLIERGAVEFIPLDLSVVGSAIVLSHVIAREAHVEPDLFDESHVSHQAEQ
jgi:hypothetical protein